MTVPGTDLDLYRDDFVINESTESNYGDIGTYTLSKILFWDTERPSASNVTIYATDVFVKTDNGAFGGESICNAFFGDTACLACNPCSRNADPAIPFLQHNVVLRNASIYSRKSE